MKPLSNCPVGQNQTIRWILGNSLEVESIRDLGFSEGSIVTVISSFFGNVIVSLDDIRYAISSDVASQIRVS